MGMILERGLVEITIGAVFVPGVAYTPSGYVTITCAVKNLKVKAESEKIKVSGACLDGPKNQYVKGEQMLSMESIVPVGDFMWRSPGIDPRNRWCSVRTKSNSSLAVADVWTGVLTSWEWSASEGQAQVENVEIDLTPDV
jgi:hypothetical protein